MLETVRDYAAAKLLARSQTAATAVRAAHRDHYVALAETAAPDLIGHGQMQWLDRLELELDNLRAASSHCLEDPDPSAGLRLGSALRHFWLYRQPRAEGAAVVCAALDRPDAQQPTITRGRALVTAAILLTAIAGEYDAAAARAQEALGIARDLRDEHLRAEALYALAISNWHRGDEEAHDELADDGLTAARTLADPHLTALLLMTRGNSLRLSHADQVRACEECLELFRQTGNRAHYAASLNNLSVTEMEVGQISAARARLAEAVRIVRELGDQRGLSPHEIITAVGGVGRIV